MKQRVSRDEVLQIVREMGTDGMSKVGSVIMESDGSFSVLPESQDDAERLFVNVSEVRTDSNACP